MFLPLFIVTSAIFTIIAIAADRYRVMIYRQTPQRRETLITVAIVWVISLCVSAPQFYEYSIYTNVNPVTNRTQTHCGSYEIEEDFKVGYASTVFVLSYCVPLVILVICYIRIGLLVWRHAKRFRESRPPSSNNNCGQPGTHLEDVITARSVKVLKMLVSITVAFVLLWTPYFILFAIQVIYTRGL